MKLQAIVDTYSILDTRANLQAHPSGDARAKSGTNPSEPTRAEELAPPTRSARLPPSSPVDPLTSLRTMRFEYASHNDGLETVADKVKRMRKDKLHTAKRFLELFQGPRGPGKVITPGDIQGMAQVLLVVVNELLERA